MKKTSMNLSTMDEYYIEKIKEIYKEKYKDEKMTTATVIRLAIWNFYRKEAGE